MDVKGVTYVVFFLCGVIFVDAFWELGALCRSEEHKYNASIGQQLEATQDSLRSLELQAGQLLTMHGHTFQNSLERLHRIKALEVSLAQSQEAEERIQLRWQNMRMYYGVKRDKLQARVDTLQLRLLNMEDELRFMSWRLPDKADDIESIKLSREPDFVLAYSGWINGWVMNDGARIMVPFDQDTIQVRGNQPDFDLHGTSQGKGIITEPDTKD